MMYDIGCDLASLVIGIIFYLLVSYKIINLYKNTNQLCLI